MSECRCGVQTRDDAFVCDQCGDELAQALNEMEWLDDELEITIGRHRGIDYRALGGSAGAEAALPWHEAASEARRHLRAVLVSWVRFCDEEGVRNSDPGIGMPDDTMPSMARWLLWRIDGLALLDIGPEAHDEITSAVAHCRLLIDRRPEREYVGPCECGRDLYRRPGAPTVKCRHCEVETDPEAMLTWMRDQVADRLVTAMEGAGLLSKFGLPTTPRIIYGWVERKRLTPHSGDGKTRLYLFADLLDLAAKREAS